MNKKYSYKHLPASKSVSERISVAFWIGIAVGNFQDGIVSFEKLSRTLKVAICSVLFVLGTITTSNLYAQCNVATASSAFAAPTCTDQTKSLGAGQYESMSFTNTYIYTFSIADNAQSNGICINGTNLGTSFTYTASTTGSLNVAAYRNNGTWDASSAVITYRISSPAITTQPSDPTAVCSGSGSQDITVAATGVGLTYQWRKSATPVANGGIYSNMTTATMTMTAPASSDAGSYDVVITNTGGCTTTSSAATSVVSEPSAPPVITGTTATSCTETTDLDLDTSVLPTGGTITSTGGYRIHTFTSSGTFTTITGFNPENVEVLVVAGGGGGGTNGGGGGGAGGLTYDPASAVSAATAYPVTVGTGGSSASPGNNGTNSVFNGITTTGGGGGASRDGGGAGVAGGSGGGGGGCTAGNSSGATAGAAGGSGTSNAGGNGTAADAGCWAGGGGGGGAGGAGTAASTNSSSITTAGTGGAGLAYSISGASVTYAAGGGGGWTGFEGGGCSSPSGWDQGGAGGSSGVGGNGESTAGAANTGSGGGAERSGAAGVVIIRYPDPTGGTWTTSDAGVATVNATSGLVTGVAQGTATISYTYDAGGCTSPAVTQDVTVDGIPTAVTASAANNPECTGNTLTLTGGATSVGALTWAWTGPNSYSSTMQSPTIPSITAAAAGTYSLVATNGCGSAAVATTAAVTVTTLPAATISYAGTPFCISLGAGQPVTETGTAGGVYTAAPGGLTIDSGSGDINPSTSTAGTYTVTYTIAAAAGCAQVETTTTVTIKALPSISVHPTDPAAINSGAGTANFTVTASGGDISYQWQEDNGGGFLDITDGGIYSGATTAALSITNPPSSMNGYDYRCVVSGCAPDATSTSANMTVNTIGNPTPCYGTTQNYNVTNVAGVTYTWTAPSGWTVSSGQGTNSVNFLVGVNSGTVTCTPSNCSGNGPVRELAVDVASVSIASDDADNEICSGTSVVFTATPTNGGTPTYRWKKNGAVISGETGVTYTSSTLANTDAISVEMTSSAGCVITSSALIMTVNTSGLTASVTISSENTTICSGISNTFTAIPVNGGTPTYQWQIDGVDVGGETAVTYTSTTLANTNTVTVVMTSTYACIAGSPATSNAIAMTVNANYTASVSIAPTPTGTICTGTSVSFVATPTNGGTTPSYQWKKGASNVGTNSATYVTTSLADNDKITVLLSSNLACTTPIPVTSNTVTMTVNSAVDNNTVSAAQVICTGSTPAALTGSTPTNGSGTYTYLWEESTTSSTTGFAAATGTNNTINYTPPALTSTTWYRRTVTSTPCSDNVSTAIEITVNTAIANNSITLAQSICSGATPDPLAGSVPTNGNGVYTYLWESAEDSGFTVNLTSEGTGQDFTPGALTVDTWYRRTVSSAPCASDVSASIKMTILPDLPASVTVAASATNVCDGTSVTFTPTPTNGGTSPTYQWQKNAADITGEVYATYTSTDLIDADQIRVVMTSNASPCLTTSPATSAAVTMAIDAIPIATATNSAQTVCSGVAIADMVLGTSNAVAGTTFAWTRDNTTEVTGIASSGTGTPISGTLTHTLTTSQTVTFTITPTGPAATNCPGDDITATVIIDPSAPAPVAAITGVDSTYDGFTEHYKIDAYVPAATTYTWTVPTGWSISSGQGEYLLKTVAGTTGQNGDVTVTASNGCGSSAATTYAVVVRGTSTAANATPCEGTTERYTTQRRNDVSYRWEVPADWNILTGAASNSMTTTIGATAGLVTVIEYNSCGDGTAQTFSVTPNPRPVMTSADASTSCSDVALSIPLTSSGGAATYEWIAADNGSTTGESITTQTVTTIADVVTNPGPGASSITYSVTPTITATGCIGTDGGVSPQIITVIVNPAGYWTGIVSDRWDVAGNWCGEPSCTADAFIPSEPTGGNFPVIRLPDEVCRDLTISADASLTLDGDGLSVCGDWLNYGDFISNSEKVTFWAADRNQSIGGNAENYFYDLYIANTGTDGSLDNVTLTQPVTVTNQLNLSDGVLVTDDINLLTLTNTATNATTGGNSSGPSFVSGPMRWNGIDGAGPYIFPTGKDTKWARIAISDLTAATDFQAEYFNSSFSDVSGDDVEIAPSAANPLYGVSALEYWHFYRIGTGDGKVRLYWEDANWSGINDCAPGGDLHIGHWDPSNSANNGSTLGSWENNNDAVTPSGSCGGTTAGSIVTDNVVTEFSPFTFASKIANLNPLPVELLYFNATYNGETVDVSWETAAEINNDYFIVERSTDGVNFESIGLIIPSKAKDGNSTANLNYAINDADVLPGVYYYRLKQTDFNGEFKYSAIDVIEIKGSSEFSFNVSPNPSDGTALYSTINAEKGKEIIIVVYDVLGQEIYTKIIVTEQKGNTIYAIDLNHNLSTGVYLITATSDNKIYSKRLVVN